MRAGRAITARAGFSAAIRIRGRSRAVIDDSSSLLSIVLVLHCFAARDLGESRRDIPNYKEVIARAYNGDEAISSISVHFEDPSKRVNVETW